MSSSSILRTGAKKKKEGQTLQSLQIKKSTIALTEAAGAIDNPLAYKSPLWFLRREKDISLRMITRRIGIDKSRLLRLEREAWKKVTLEEATLLAKVLGVKVEDFISESKDCGTLTRSSVDEPCWSFEITKGIEIASFEPKPKDHFAGTLKIGPQKTLTKSQAPKGEFIFYCVLKGQVFLTHDSKETLLKEGDCISLESRGEYELSNTHPFQAVTLLLFSVPAVIQANF